MTTHNFVRSPKRHRLPAGECVSRGLCLLAFALLFPACHRPPDPANFNLTLLADPPEWSLIDPYQRSMTRDEFVEAVQTVYSDGPAHKTTIKIRPKYADITRSTRRDDIPPYRFQFARDKEEARRFSKWSTAYWRPGAELAADTTPERPLRGIRIAVDPGHIGGDWAKMEERWFRIGTGTPVAEGTMALQTARILKTELEKRGAIVTLVRDSLEPVTHLRPRDFEQIAADYLIQAGFDPPPQSYATATGDLPGGPMMTVQWQSEKLFYRSQEIRDRAVLVNHVIRPDLILCLHFNAERWGNPSRPTLRSKNHFHVLTNGTYSLSEFSLDDQRFQMMNRLAQRIHQEEIPLATTVAETFAAITELPPASYDGTYARRVNDSKYLWVRNLLATRSYQCPVVFFEPYVMNDRTVYRRIQNADKESPSIFDEYATAVTKGLVRYYTSLRTGTMPPLPKPPKEEEEEEEDGDGDGGENSDGEND